MTFRRLKALDKSFMQFDGVEATKQRREEMAGLIKKTEMEGLFTRIDKGKVINLHYHDPEKIKAADVQITVSSDNKFQVMTYELWSSMTGLHEVITENGYSV